MAAFEALPKPVAFKLTTAPVRRVLEALGRPQDRMPPVIHVAGTNGKGSTTAFMRAIAQAHGLKVHVDTSPHLIRVNERIRIAGELISDDMLKDYLERVLKANAGEPLSFFEGMTCVAYLAFSEVPADLALIEVGLGGRFDSTNVFDRVAASVITPIDFDHKDFLGPHICQIAWEKAGIIKPGSPVVSAKQGPEVARTLRAEAIYQGTDILFVDDLADVTGSSENGSIHLDGLVLDSLALGLVGPHQVHNAALAISALKAADTFELTEDAVRKGLRDVSWPARLQVLSDGPLTRLLPGKTVLLDGGHNPHAAIALAKALKDRGPLPLVMAMLKTKDVSEYLREIAPIAGAVVAVPMPHSKNGHDPEHLASAARKLGLFAHTAPDLNSALKKLAGEAGDHVMICGSLYLAGDVLALNDEIIR